MNTEDTTSDLETTEEVNPEVGAAVVVAVTVLAVVGVVTGCVFIWKAIDRHLARKYTIIVHETPEDPKEKKTTK